MVIEIQNLPFFDHFNENTGRLTLRGASYIPDEIFQFSLLIRILDVTGGIVTELPDNFYLLSKLTAIFLGENNFTVFPAVLAKCINLRIISFKNGSLQKIYEDSFPKNLEWLVLTNNPDIGEIPNSIGNCIDLRKLALAGTGISSLPDSLQNCKKLEFLRISACKFILPIPHWVYNFPRLAWYTDSGNSTSHRPSGISGISTIEMSDINMLGIINETNISIVSGGHIRLTGQDIVIKKFKNGITSDGYAIDDMKAAIAAGTHPNLMALIALLQGLPGDDMPELIFARVPDSYHKLGNPPSLDSCTRDTYPLDTKFDISHIIKILQSIASACVHLHGRGIAHGDLYAHNILVNHEGHAILGDFGAATIYDPFKYPEYEFYDVRAFGCLIGELISRVNISHIGNTALLVIQKLGNDCMKEDIYIRPTFNEIQNILMI